MRRSIATLLLLVLPLTACHKWEAPEVRPDVGPDRAATYDEVRVRTTDGETRVLHRAEVRPDSVIGYEEERDARGHARRVRLSREEIAELEVRRTDTIATLLTVLGVGTGMILGVSLLCAASGCLEVGGLGSGQ